MKINPSPVKSSQAGSTLLITLVVASLVGLTLVAYLKMTGNQNYFVARSQAWNASVPIIEAGLEEALAHLNRNGTTNGNLLADGWTLVNGAYTKANYVGSNFYVVAIAFTGSKPDIVSQGYVPLQLNYASLDGPIFADILSGQNLANPYVYRSVKATTSAESMFAKGMVAKGQINLNGFNVHSDSFDSTDPLLSTFGLYDPVKARDNGDIATNSGLTNSLAVGNAKLWGHVATGPNGSISIGPNGVVGSKVWALDPADAGKIQPGWSADDMNVTFPPVNDPGGSFWSPGSDTVNGTNYDYVLSGGNYWMWDFKMEGNSTKGMMVTAPSVLWVWDDVSLSGNAQITIAPGGSLKFYVGTQWGSDSKASISGNGIVNQTGNATNFTYYGLPSNQSLSYSGNAAFVGAIYAPSADFALGGGGNNTYDFVGASVSNTVKMNGHFNFHYDENLGRVGPRRGYITTSWNEITLAPLTPPPGFFIK